MRPKRERERGEESVVNSDQLNRDNLAIADEETEVEVVVEEGEVDIILSCLQGMNEW